MYILCDTCSVLMLIRVAPDMFCDERYACVTIQEVIQELFRNQKFKTKYPWRKEVKNKIKAMGASKLENDDFVLYFSTIKHIIAYGKINRKTKRAFSLSRVDQKIAACSIAHNYKLTTTDNDLIDFVIQEFDGETITPLGIINDWLEKGLIRWNDSLQAIIEDWERCNEHPQPRKEAKKFTKLTGYKYIGPMLRK